MRKLTWMNLRFLYLVLSLFLIVIVFRAFCHSDYKGNMNMRIGQDEEQTQYMEMQEFSVLGCFLSTLFLFTFFCQVCCI
jgi:hypothetical protein